MSKTYRIRTEVGVDRQVNIELEQDFDQLEILSLKVRSEDVYTRMCADYGVVVGRGCLGKPWLFRDLVDAFSGREVQASPNLGFVLNVMQEHAQGLMEIMGPDYGIRNFRKHCGWYLTGYPVGSEVRRSFATVSTR